MPIEFSCGNCGKQIRAPDNLAGKQGRCPQCQTIVDVPPGSSQAVPLPPPAPETAASPFDFDAPSPELDPEARRPCPMCGEPILVTAIKCRFCGEVFDRVLRETSGPRLKREFDNQTARLGWIWTFIGVLTVVAVLVILTSRNMRERLDLSLPILMVLGVLAAIWLVAGIGSFKKQVWAIWLGLVLSYIALALDVVTLVAGVAQVNSGGLCLRFGLLISAIYHGHKALGIARRMQ